MKEIIRTSRVTKTSVSNVEGVVRVFYTSNANVGTHSAVRNYASFLLGMMKHKALVVDADI